MDKLEQKINEIESISYSEIALEEITNNLKGFAEGIQDICQDHKNKQDEKTGNNRPITGLSQ